MSSGWTIAHKIEVPFHNTEARAVKDARALFFKQHGRVKSDLADG